MVICTHISIFVGVKFIVFGRKVLSGVAFNKYFNFLKMKNHLCIIISLAFLASSKSQAQTRYYCYDAAGNRVARSATSTYSTTNGWGKGEAEEDALNSDVCQNNIISFSKILYK